MARFRLAGAVVIGLLLASAGSAAAAGVDRQAWAWTVPVGTYMPTESEIYVASTATHEEARSFVRIDTAGVERPALDRAVLRLTESTNGLFPEDADLAACALSEPLVASGELEGELPAEDCSIRTTPMRDDDGVWEVELAVFAELWASGTNNGVVILPAGGGPVSWRVTWDTSRTELVLPSGSTTPTTDPPQFDTGSDPDTTPVLPDFDDLPPPLPEPDEPVLPPPSEPAVPDDTPTAPPTAGDLEPTFESGQGDPKGRDLNVGSAVLAMFFLALGALVVVLATPLRRRVVLPTLDPDKPGGRGLVPVLAVSVLLFLPMLGREVIVFKAGVVLIFFVAAVGLHVLVNWAGQLSLAHAAMVGLPAFGALALSEEHGISPIYLIPVAVLIGAVTGAVVALPTLRAKELQVALVTLVGGIAIGRYFFNQTWLVGSAGGRAASTPRLGPWEFTTSRSLYPILVVVVAAAVLAAYVMMHSKVVRALSWVRSDPAAASAFGIPVVRYRIGAYVAGGAFAGLAGGLTVMWVERLGKDAFPSTLSFAYLLAAVVAGNGFLGGLGFAATVLSGGPLFAVHIFGADVGDAVEAIIVYAGPLGLIDIITRHQTGINGLGRKLMHRIRSSERLAQPAQRNADSVSLSLIGGVVLICAGFVAIALAWQHSSNTDQLWIQSQEILSGGIGGIALILVGVGLLIRDQLAKNEFALASHLEALLTSGALVADDAADDQIEPAESVTETLDVTGVPVPVEAGPTRRARRTPIRARR